MWQYFIFRSCHVCTFRRFNFTMHAITIKDLIDVYLYYGLMSLRKWTGERCSHLLPPVNLCFLTLTLNKSGNLWAVNVHLNATPDLQHLIVIVTLRTRSSQLANDNAAYTHHACTCMNKSTSQLIWTSLYIYAYNHLYMYMYAYIICTKVLCTWSITNEQAYYTCRIVRSILFAFGCAVLYTKRASRDLVAWNGLR